MDEDKLTPEEVQEIRAEVWAEDADIRLESVAPSQRIVAEGDSWFDYLPGLDVLVQLRRRHDYRIKRVAKAGDTIENMAYGTEIRRDFSREPSQLLQTVEAVQRHKPPVVLLSGGGNDFAGEEFEAFLNHRGTGLDPLRSDHLRHVLQHTFKSAYEFIAREIWNVKDDTHIICHGYGYAIPDGRGVINLPFGFKFIGPWLRGPLAKKGITSFDEGKAILRVVIDEFNDMLADFASGDDRIHYVDLRGLIGDDDWVNELHLKNSAFGRVADRFHEEIVSISP